MKKTKITAYVFIALECALYAAFLAVDLGGGPSDISSALKYAGVVSACAFFVGRKNIYIQCAQVFVLAADFLLLFTDRFALGIAFFCVVQAFYHAYAKGRFFASPVSAVMLLCAAILLAADIFGVYDMTLPLALFYGACLIYNLALSLAVKKYFFAFGVALLLLCDVCVAIYNCASVAFVSLPPAAVRFASVGMWLFYLPSQTAVALCSLNEKNGAQKR